MPAIPDPDLRSIAEELERRPDAPHGLPHFDWRYTEETGRRARLAERRTSGSREDESEPPGTAVIDFEDGPAYRFTYEGVEYEAAWDRWYRIVAYRVVPGTDGAPSAA